MATTHNVHAALSCSAWDHDIYTADYSANCAPCESQQASARQKRYKREDRLFTLKYWGTVAVGSVGLIWLVTWLTAGVL